MRRILFGLGSCLTIGSSACADFRVPSGGLFEVVWWPERAGSAERVIQLRVQARLAPEPLPSDIALFEGDVASSALQHGNFEALPKSLLERRVPLRVAREGLEPGLWVVPQRVLTPGLRYTLAARGVGRIGFFDVTPQSERELLQRIWPTQAPLTPRALFCGGSTPLPAVAWELTATAGARMLPVEQAVWVEGVSLPACAWLELYGTETSEGLNPGANFDSGWVVPPGFGNYLLEPHILGELTPEPDPELDCGVGELSLGPACARVSDDRLLIGAADFETLWELHWHDPQQLAPDTELHAVAPRQLWALRGLEPQTALVLSGEVQSPSGRRWAFEALVETGAERSHWQISELLSNPLGAEPQAEWIELLNDAAAAHDLAGHTLDDGSARTPLPSFVVGPGEYVLVAREDFVGGPPDVLLAPGTRVLRVPSLGKSGLANSGETWTLRDPNGEVLSVFPALAARVAGQSVARRSSDAPDGDPRSFAAHTGPGASPGAPNQVGVATD